MLRMVIISLITILLVLGCSEEKSNTENLEANNFVPGDISYSVPTKWESEKPVSQMRKAQYNVPGVDGAEDAELVVFVFPGGGGTTQANIDRWLGQFKQPDGSDTQQKSEIKNIKVNDFLVTTIYVTGTHLKSSSPMMMDGPKEEFPNYAMLAAIVETGKNPWFFKMVGPQKTVDYWRPEFDKFVSSFK